MNSIVYELQRTFRSKFVIVMVCIIVLVAGLIAYLLASGPSNVPVSQRIISDSGLFSVIDGLFGFLIPILAIFMGYFTYGKDRTSGVLESVVTRPVTKSQLLITRFLASVLAILIAVVAAIFVIDAGKLSYFHTGIPTDMIAALIWTYLVEGAAFIGLVYLFSHVLKSQSSLLGISIALFLVFSLLWATISDIVLLEVFHATFSSLSSLQGQINFAFASPSGYERNVAVFMTKSMTIGVGGIATSVTIDPASYGITFSSLGAIGIIWMVAPIIIAYVLSKKLD